MTKAKSQDSLIKVAAVIVLSVTLIVIGDTAGKQLTRIGFDPMFVAASRFSVGTILLLPFCGLQLKELKLLFSWPILFRSTLIASAIFCILTALKSEQIANVFGAFFISPIVAFVLSAIVLKERTTFIRLILVLVGFVGVLFVVKPGVGVSEGILFALLAGCFHGTYLVTTRWLANTYRLRFLLISQLIIGSVVLLPFGIGTEIHAINYTVISLIAISALGSAIGNYFLLLASKTSEASIIAPLIYSQLVVATFIGYVVFSDLPDSVALFGLSIILLSGLGSLWLVKRQRR